MNKLVSGTIVSSKQGRDVNKFYMVVDIDYNMERVLIADGDKKTLEKPKCKNIRHIQPTKTVLPEQEQKTNLLVKTALRAYEKNIKQKCSESSKG